MKLTTALTYAISTLSLTSTSFAAKNSSVSLRGNDLGVDGPFDELKCSIEGKTDKSACSTAVTVDGLPCSYCTEGQDEGLCVNPDIASQMTQMNPAISCTNVELDDVVEEKKSVSLRGNDLGVDGPFSELKCFFEGKTDETACSTAVTDDGLPCSYCTEEDAGICVNPDIASQMAQMNPEISCTNTELADIEFNKKNFVCEIQALNDAGKCSKTKTSSGKPCEFCTVSGPFGSQGLCVSPGHAKEMKKVVKDNVSCVSHEGITFNDDVENNPVTDCNIHGVDHDTCLDPSLVNGSVCSWCDAKIGGFCVPKGWEDTVGKFLTCEDAKDTEETEIVPEIEDNQVDIDPSFLDSNCFKVGLKGSSPDDCRAAIDDKTGNNCIYCSVPRIGLGICVTPDFKGHEGHMYTCDTAAVVAVE